MDFKVLFIHPLDTGLKAYIKFYNNIYFLTFQADNNSEAEFIVYSDAKNKEILTDSDLRKELLNNFILFLKQNKEEIKLGIYIEKSKEVFDIFFTLNNINKDNGLINISFNILDNSYSIYGLRVIKTKSDIILDVSSATFIHSNTDCFCENIKQNHNIEDLKDCLILIEHQEIILDWVKEVYQYTYHPKKQNNIIHFPRNK
ncbi:hypothetical protein AAGG74_17440 [Bacillus mexicanus]|uniref:hypothetical protein n=1 Tax=Bacillus mexicanus TaxID=2834415 RepID=UPI003D214E9A